jgi:hypothetical protein
MGNMAQIFRQGGGRFKRNNIITQTFLFADSRDKVIDPDGKKRFPVPGWFYGSAETRVG